MLMDIIMGIAAVLLGIAICCESDVHGKVITSVANIFLIIVAGMSNDKALAVLNAGILLYNIVSLVRRRRKK